MPLDYNHIKNWDFPEVTQTYGEKDSILYALGLGLGEQPTDPRQLRYVYEAQLKAFPTQAVVLAYPGFWMQDPKSGIDWVRIVHGEQRLRLHRPLPVSGTVRARARVTHVIDKGADKGALVIVERTLVDAATGAELATVNHTTFCRADGGFGQGDTAPEALPAAPARAPDAARSQAIMPQAALLYRLNADPNPLHADPEVARAAGFDAPILHGLCTYGVAARALVDTFANGDGDQLLELNVRFSRPVFPGETLEVRMWREGGGRVLFDARVPARDVTVLSNGVAEFRA
ncbi:MaoC/PaaZ C-terminal domain-containing protein [Cupriavidus basilensis]|uniref:MaoC/PaaZ C-terminal domain-containing protein n=1 Tax=Cupriavidus basilensis TaxID=68895 RepID=UPI00157AA943|nr:MaoC/PaaZ C-terminal domain-containing protein [Cupriavidus basilensis]NUA26751.1 3-alpha,7-alpha,12-alpha-trihydroxy-5-beta-cholest-24-enoyl-CoA hydratase [Cupriavidus basilensis]